MRAAWSAMSLADGPAQAACAGSTSGLEARTAAISANAGAAGADPRVIGNRAACAAAMRDARTALRPILQRWRTAERAHRAALTTARNGFWATVNALRGTTAPPPDPVPPVDPDPIGIT